MTENPFTLVPGDDRVSSSSTKAASERYFFTHSKMSNNHDSLRPEVSITKWVTPASPTPDLAPSTFGLEDGNLIISFPLPENFRFDVLKRVLRRLQSR